MGPSSIRRTLARRSGASVQVLPCHGKATDLRRRGVGITPRSARRWLVTRRTGSLLHHDVDGRILDEVWDRIEIARHRRRGAFRNWAPAGVVMIVALGAIALWFVPRGGPLHLKDGRPVMALLSSSTAFDDGSYVDVAEGARIVPVDNRATAFGVRLEGGKA